MGQNRLHHGFHRGRGLGNLGLEADDHFLSLATLNPALQGDLQADALGGLGMGLFLQGHRDNLVQNRNGSLGQSLFNRIIHLTPQAVPRSRRGRVCRYQHKQHERQPSNMICLSSHFTVLTKRAMKYDDAADYVTTACPQYQADHLARDF